MARKDRDKDRKSPKEQLDAYKKDIGKQYMDGLLSDKEYEKMLRDKEVELGLDVPTPAEEATGKECPSCGALVGDYDNACNICGGALQPSLKDSMVEAEPEAVGPADQGIRERVCKECGASVSEVDTICTVCGSTLAPMDLEDEAPKPEAAAVAPDVQVCPSCGADVDAAAKECPVCETPLNIVEKLAEPQSAKPEPIPIEEVQEPPKQETVCGECGATLEEGTTECFICGAKIGGEKAPEPMMEIPAEKAQPGEVICGGCGATLEEGTTECFICGAKVGETPAEEAPQVQDVVPVPAQTLPVEPEPIPVDDDIPELEAKPEEPIPEQTTEEPVIEEGKPEPKEVILGEGEIVCPSCSSVIKEDNEKCPECWTDLLLYVKCPSCYKLTPSGETSCRECFATLVVTTEVPAEQVDDLLLDGIGPELDIPDQLEISDELKNEMAALEAQEEQGKECLVCGAIFGPDDEFCPVCGMEYGVEIEEPEMPQSTWEAMEVEIQPLIHTCPSCGNNVTGLEATDREVSESKWFYRGLVAIFTGIFFTSFSIWARGVSVENSSLGLHPPPTDVLVNIFGWILVIMGSIFWYLSWRLHDQRTECPSCGIETEPGMGICVNCGVALDDSIPLEGEDEPPMEEEPLDEQVLEEELPREMQAEQPVIDDSLEVPYEDAPAEEPEMQMQTPAPEPTKPEAKPAKAPTPTPPVKQEEPVAPKPHFEHGEELAIEHEEHKKCPGCGIFVDVNDTVCPICDTAFSVPAPEPEVPTEDEELASIAPAEPAVEPSMDNITIPKASAGSVECPSCGAELEAGTKACPVCEYPIDD